MKEKITINSYESLSKAQELIYKQFNENKYLTIEINTGKQRTRTQNASMHLYWDLMAKNLNDGGFTVAQVLSKPLEISWTKELFGEIVWRSIQSAILGKRSTKKLERQECSQIFDEVNRAMIERTGVSAQWPSKETMDGKAE